MHNDKINSSFRNQIYQEHELAYPHVLGKCLVNLISFGKFSFILEVNNTTWHNNKRKTSSFHNQIYQEDILAYPPVLGNFLVKHINLGKFLYIL